MLEYWNVGMLISKRNSVIDDLFMVDQDGFFNIQHAPSLLNPLPHYSIIPTFQW